MKMVIAGDKYDGPDICRLKLHEEYGRVWLYRCDENGRSLQDGRILCIDDDGLLRIEAEHGITYIYPHGKRRTIKDGEIEVRIKMPPHAVSAGEVTRDLSYDELRERCAKEAGA